MSKIFKSCTHAEDLVKKISCLLEGRRKYSDIQIEVDSKIFYCHKLVLALQSKYFDARLYPANQSEVSGKIVVEELCRDDFQNFLWFIYRGQIELNCQNIAGVVRAADVLCVLELKKMCAQYIIETLYIRNCLRYWRLSEKTGIEEAIQACKTLFLSEFAKVVNTCDLTEMTESMIQSAMADDNLRIAREEDICAMFIKWLDVQARKKPFQSCQLLYNIRWSAVSPEYVKSKLLNNVNIVGNCQCVKFLSSVLTYKHTGMQFDGLNTFHRPSTGIEQSVVIVGLNSGEKISQDMYRCSLQRPCQLAKLQDVPVKMEMEAAACVNGNVLYVTGIGNKSRNVYRWDALSGWGRCGDLVDGRRRHAAVIIGNTSMFVLGGYVDDKDKILSSVEQYSPVTNKWLKVGDLSHPTECAACISYKTFAYLFGGSSREQETNIDIDLDCVQSFDTATKTCSMLCRCLPQPERMLKAVVYQNMVILLNCRACILFDLDQQTFQQRDAQYAAGVSHFGFVLENQSLFIIGGRVSPLNCNVDKDQDKQGKQSKKGKRGKEPKEGRCPKQSKCNVRDKPDKKDSKKPPCCDQVKKISVNDLLGNCPTANWQVHAKLPSPCLVQACAVLTLPLCPPEKQPKEKKKAKEKESKLVLIENCAKDKEPDPCPRACP